MQHKLHEHVEVKESDVCCDDVGVEHGLQQRLRSAITTTSKSDAMNVKCQIIENKSSNHRVENAQRNRVSLIALNNDV